MWQDSRIFIFSQFDSDFLLFCEFFFPTSRRKKVILHTFWSLESMIYDLYWRVCKCKTKLSFNPTPIFNEETGWPGYVPIIFAFWHIFILFLLLFVFVLNFHYCLSSFDIPLTFLCHCFLYVCVCPRLLFCSGTLLLSHSALSGSRCSAPLM